MDCNCCKNVVQNYLFDQIKHEFRIEENFFSDDGNYFLSCKRPMDPTKWGNLVITIKTKETTFKILILQNTFNIYLIWHLLSHILFKFSSSNSTPNSVSTPSQFNSFKSWVGDSIVLMFGSHHHHHPLTSINKINPLPWLQDEFRMTSG